MSAWIVSQAHIDVLVQALAESERVTEVDPDTLGQELWRENLASVAYRYPGDGDGERPGPIDFRDADVDEYVYRRPGAKFDLKAVRLAIECYSYQSCEHPGWLTSRAKRWTDELHDELVNQGVGRVSVEVDGPYRWGYEESDVHPKVAA